MVKIRSLLTLPALVAIAITTAGAAGPAAAATGERTARVAGGEQVSLAKSRFSSRELQARRPQMEALKPQAR